MGLFIMTFGKGDRPNKFTRYLGEAKKAREEKGVSQAELRENIYT